VCEAPITSLLGLAGPLLPPANEIRPPLSGAVIRNLPSSTTLKSIQFEGAWLRYVPIQYKRYLVERTCTFDEYLGKFSSKSRKNLRRSVTKFAAEAGESCWREYSSLRDVDEFHALAAAVSEKTYQAKLFDDRIEPDDATREKLRTVAREDKFRGYILFHQGTPAAFALCESEGDVLLYKHPGYAPEYKHLSPGTVLLWHILETFFAESHFRYLDFGEGSAFYKEFFANTSISCCRVYFFRRRPVLIAVVLAHRAWSQLTDVVKNKLLPGFNVRLRRLLRARSTATVQEAESL
jgi:CelD/BcsL family acetyltransferase involved in cellulose biosynthesis